MQNSFYTSEEIKSIGFKEVGNNLLISRFARFYDVENIEIGSNVRIDDFCLLSGKIKLGDYIHISAFSALFGKFGIEMENFSGLSPRCTVFSASDDFSGDYFIGPMIDPKFTNVTGGKVHIGKYSQLGSNCVILPGVTISEGVAVGAMSLVTENLEPWKIYKGIPAKYFKDRNNILIRLGLK